MTAITSDKIEIEELPLGWDTARVTYKTKEGLVKTSIQIIDHRKDPPLQFRHDSMRLISIKCALLVLGIPLLALMTTFVYGLRAMTLVITTFGRLVCALTQARNWGDVKRISFRMLTDLPSILCQTSLETIRLMGLAFIMEIYCLYGILCPLQGRALAGQVERDMRGSDRSHSLLTVSDWQTALKDFFTNKDSKYCQYWAICFQPIAPAVVKDPVLKIEPLKPGILAV